MSGRTILVLVAALTSPSWAAGCAECADNDDCDGADLCVEGLCARPPPPRVTILSPQGPVGGPFDMAVELGFRGNQAVITVERAANDPGDPCLPFPPVIRRVVGDGGEYSTRVVMFTGLPPLGEAFTIMARVEVGGVEVSASLPVVGPPPPPDIGGVRIRNPGAVDVDVLRTPLTTLDVESPTTPRAFVEPAAPFSANGDIAPSTPKIALVPDGDGWRGEVPAVRGPHIVWVEADIGGVTRRCGRGRVGGPDEIADDELEVLLLSRSLEGDPHLVELSARVGGAFCDGRTESSAACRGHVAATEEASSRDGLVVGIVDGLVEIAAIPRIASGPVDVQIRVSRGDRHVAFFGPVTIQPALGETWVGGRLTVAAGEVQGVVESVAPPGPGLPW